MDYSHNGPDRLYGWPPSCLATSRPSPAATRGRSGGGEGGSGNARAFSARRGKARRHVTSCFFRGTWLFPAVPRLPSAFVQRRLELESEPKRSLAMDSALSDQHNGSTEASSPANGTTRPPSTPEGIALAYGSLLLMALLPIFFGALRSVRCARGKVGSGREPKPSTPIPATAPTSLSLHTR